MSSYSGGIREKLLRYEALLRAIRGNGAGQLDRKDGPGRSEYSRAESMQRRAERGCCVRAAARL